MELSFEFYGDRLERHACLLVKSELRKVVDQKMLELTQLKDLAYDEPIEPVSRFQSMLDEQDKKYERLMKEFAELKKPK